MNNLAAELVAVHLIKPDPYVQKRYIKLSSYFCTFKPGLISHDIFANQNTTYPILVLCQTIDFRPV